MLGKGGAHVGANGAQLFVRLDVTDLAAIGAFALRSAGIVLTGRLFSRGCALRGWLSVGWRGCCCDALGFITSESSLAIALEAAEFFFQSEGGLVGLG